MKLSAQVISWNSGTPVFTYTPGTDSALNLIGMGWIDHRYDLVKNMIRNQSVIVTDTDLLAHDDYMATLCKSAVVVLVAGCTSLSASPKRLKEAEAKLKEAGFKVRYNAALPQALSRIEKIK